MHYVPESARAWLEGEAGAATAGDDGGGFHLRSAPLYALTGVVAILLLGDVLGELLSAGGGDATWRAWQKPFGLRLALLGGVLGGARIVYQTLDGLLQGRVGADLALTVATVSAILLGEFQTAALVVLIALVGESIEGYTVDRAAQAVRKLFAVRPAEAHVLRGGREQDLPLGSLAVGDLVVVRPGERIPVDGVVTEGSTSVDESSLTGESRAIEKQPGAQVFSGTLNQVGWITLQTTAVGEATALGQVLRLVSEATARKAPLERQVDRLARWFLPTVLIAAGLTLVGWRIGAGQWSAGVLPALAVLVVACPCPLILATPSAVLAALSWLARRGVVIKGSASLERLAEVNVVGLDKTGTLTAGVPEVMQTVAVSELQPAELLQLAAAAERRSEHLLGRLLVRSAEEQNLVVADVRQFTAIVGRGVMAEIDPAILPASLRRAAEFGNRVIGQAASERAAPGWSLLVGNRRLLDEAGVVIPPDWDEPIDAADALGSTPLLVAVVPAGDRPGKFLGLIAVRDTIRPEAAAVLRELRELGIASLTVLTGDRSGAARGVARQLGTIDDVRAELLPADKAAWVSAQQAAGERVAMIGDGANDAPALAAASVGLAIARPGSDLILEAGDILLLGDPLAPLPGLVRLSRALVRTIRRGVYVFAFGVNGLGVLLSAWGVLSPATGAIFHEVASLAVMLSALRLLWFESPQSGRFARWLAAGQTAVERAADWVSPAGWVHWGVRNGALVGQLGFALALVVWCLWNWCLIASDERALVFRAGRVVEELEPGLHLRWPPPLERVDRERVGRIRAIPLGFRSAAGARRDDGTWAKPVEWQADHGRGESERVADEAQLLVADELLIDLAAEVQYRIRDLRAFRMAATRPEALLRAEAEGVLRAGVARVSLERLLTGAREPLSAACRDALQRAADRYGLGVEVIDLRLIDLHPPAAVVPAYRSVANALEEREQEANQARAAATQTVFMAGGETAVASIVGPEALRRSAGDWSQWRLTDDRWRELVGDGAESLVLAGTAAERIAAAEQDRTARRAAADGDRARFRAMRKTAIEHPLLTRLELYWRQVERVLADRPLMIVDPQAVRSRQMWLNVPEPPGRALPGAGRAAGAGNTLPDGAPPTSASPLPDPDESAAQPNPKNQTPSDAAEPMPRPGATNQ